MTERIEQPMLTLDKTESRYTAGLRLSFSVLIHEKTEMKKTPIILLLLLVNNIYCQMVKIVEMGTLEPIIGAQVISCETTKQVGVSNFDGEINIDSTFGLCKITYQGFYNRIENFTNLSSEQIQLRHMESAMTLGTSGSKIHLIKYNNEVKNSCPDEIKYLKGEWIATSGNNEQIGIIFEHQLALIYRKSNNNIIDQSLKSYTIKNDSIYFLEFFECDTEYYANYNETNTETIKEYILPFCLFRETCSESYDRYIGQFELISEFESIE